MQQWWQHGTANHGTAQFQLHSRLKFIKKKLKEWSKLQKTNFQRKRAIPSTRMQEIVERIRSKPISA